MARYIKEFLHNSRRWFEISCIISVLLPALAYPIHAEDHSVEYKIKADYLYNFTKFVDWPIEHHPQNQTLKICLLGDDPFGSLLDPLQSKKSKGRPIQVIRFKRMDPDIAQCQILFIAESEIDQLEQILKPLSGISLLTVGNTEQFTLSGGMVGFVIDRGRVRLQINRTAVDNASLTISAKLLEVAQIVSPK